MTKIHRDNVQNNPERYSTKALLNELKRIETDLNQSVDGLVNDPMTSAMGAPVGDFIRDWNCRSRRKRRRIVSELVKRGAMEYEE